MAYRKRSSRSEFVKEIRKKLLEEYKSLSDEQLRTLYDGYREKHKKMGGGEGPPRPDASDYSKLKALNSELRKIEDVKKKIENPNVLEKLFGSSPKHNYTPEREIEVRQELLRIRNKLARYDEHYRTKIEPWVEERKKLHHKIQVIRELLKKRREQKQKAKIAAVEGRTRQIASAIKTKTKATDICMYCGQSFSNGHLDHIYPVSRGGLSAEENLVLVCSSCNKLKRDMTLYKFCLKYGHDFFRVAERLETMGKIF